MAIKRAEIETHLDDVRKALYSLPAAGYDLEEDLLHMEGWLDALASSLSTLAQLDPEPATLDGVVDEVGSRPEFHQLVAVKEQIYRLYEYASCVAYGVVAVGPIELNDAGGCFQDVSSAVEATLEAFPTD